MLEISLTKLAFIVVKAREFDAKVDPVEPDPASNPTDDGDREILEDLSDDTTETELEDALRSLNEDELDELVALLWLGRGDYEPEQWDDALRQARERRTGDTAAYLMGTPLLGDYLAEGAAGLGYSLEVAAANHL